MVSVYDVDATKLINKLAEKLSKVAKSVAMPEWAKFVKTGAHKERPPSQENWWYIRAAAVLRTIYKSGPVGISKLRSKYGGAKNRGRKPHKFKKGSGKIIRTIVQQLEEGGYLEKAEKSKGRVVSSQGQSLLEKTASEVYVKRPALKKVEVKKAVVKPVIVNKETKPKAAESEVKPKVVMNEAELNSTVKKADKKPAAKKPAVKTAKAKK